MHVSVFFLLSIAIAPCLDMLVSANILRYGAVFLSTKAEHEVLCPGGTRGIYICSTIGVMRDEGFQSHCSRSALRTAFGSRFIRQMTCRFAPIRALNNKSVSKSGQTPHTPTSIRHLPHLGFVETRNSNKSAECYLLHPRLFLPFYYASNGLVVQFPEAK